MARADAADQRAEMEAERAHGAEGRGDGDGAMQHRNEADKQEHWADELRETLAEGLDHVENRAAVDARVRSDVAQARPATDATPTATSQTSRTAQRIGRSR